MTQAEDDVAAQEARVLEEVGRRVAMAHLNLEHEFDVKLGLIRAEAEGRTATLRAKLEEATRRADTSRAALEAAQKELAASQAEVLRLRQRMEEAEAVERQNADEIRQRRILEHAHGPMLTTLRERANTALGNICEAAVGAPHATNYTGNLQFFTDIMTQLEAQSVRANRLVEERAAPCSGAPFPVSSTISRTWILTSTWTPPSPQFCRPSGATWRGGWRTTWMRWSGPSLPKTTRWWSR